MFSSQLQDVIKISNLINKLSQIKRTLYLPNETPERFENVAEHTLQLAMVSWYLITTQKLDFDIDKVLKYSLVHDLLEIYTDDFDAFMFVNDPSFTERKVEMEKHAMSKLSQELGEKSDIFVTLRDYEHKTDKEAKFVYCVDKLLPKINLYNGGRTPKDTGTSRETSRKITFTKTKDSPYIQEIMEEIYSYWDNIPDSYAEKDFIPEYKKMVKSHQN